jgi:hypothetical protein
VFIFWRLLLAHLIADFPLQTDKVFALKRKGGWGVSVHAGIVGLVTLLFSIPYLGRPQAWAAIGILWLGHVLFDGAKLQVTRRLGLKGENLWFFLADQVFHVAVIWLVSYRLVGSSVVGASIPVYGSTRIIRYICGYLIATYGATILIWSARRTVSGDGEIPLPGPSLKWREFLERILVTTGIVLGSWGYLLLPLGLIPRGIMRAGSPRPARSDFVLSLLLAAAIGVWMRWF